MPHEPEPYYFLDLVKRTMDILETVAAKDEMSVADLVRTLKLDRNAVNRVLLTLTDLGYLTRLDNKRYALTMKLFRLSSKALNGLTLPRLVNRHMRALADDFGETVCLGQRNDLHVLTIDVVSSSLPVRYVSHIGNTAPLHNASMGKCILAAMDDEELEETMNRIVFKAHTRKSIMNKKQLWTEIRKIRRQGYAFDDEEWSEGVRCVGAPIYNRQGECSHALSISGMARMFTGERLKSMIDRLLTVKQVLAKDMGLTDIKV
ncbi:MAG: IclR family transcriptional regulator [Deltaproteobacteria bacterium]|jgi:DNA-binding IclR family transcriptional regulator|nr:IclR family transcriptional regulator [Deltaproteobacteria bacterium]